MTIRRAQSRDLSDWQRMRDLLWPGIPSIEHQEEMGAYQTKKNRAVFVADSGSGELVGFLEAGTRDVADGCDTSPAGYIEGWFVEENHRKQGIGRSLVEAAERWAKQIGCQEMASDCVIENEISLRSHLKLGYAEVNRCVHFRKRL